MPGGGTNPEAKSIDGGGPRQKHDTVELSVTGVFDMTLITKIAASLLTLSMLLMAPLNASDSDSAKNACIDSWLQSDAARTCLPYQISGSDGSCSFAFRCIVNMDCTLDKPCNPNSGAVVESGMTWQGAAGDVARLQNCSGTIQASPCSADSVAGSRDDTQRGVGRFE